MHKIKALAITGPTASGKTSLSLEVGEALGCEIICLDSMQIYKRMDIGTAKATAEEQARIRHHMLDVIMPTESFSAQDYKKLATECARDVSSRGRLPLFVGGTGLYLDTLMRNQSDSVPQSSEEYRLSLPYDTETEEGRCALYERLTEVDPVSAAKIHKNNVRRVVRALEIFDKTGKPKSYFDELSKKDGCDFDLVHVTLDFHVRDTLYRRIDERVDAMIKNGLVDEVRALCSEGILVPDSTAASAIGYKEILESITKSIPLDRCIESVKQATRNYAKRQLTWFRHNSDAIRIFADDAEGVMRKPDALLAETLAAVRQAL